MANRSAGRKPLQQNEIVRQIRGRIVDGVMAPGTRLASHKQLQNEFRTTCMTVQRALDRLSDEGFVRTTPRAGRFVADRPPHLSRYALVFMGGPGETPNVGSRFERAILDAARVIAEERGISFANYFHVDGHLDSEGYQNLMRDMDQRKLAGVIFTFAPHELESSALLQRRDYAMVNSSPMRLPDGVTRVVDERRVPYRAIQSLLAEGRQRFAVITKPGGDRMFPDEFGAYVDSIGAITYPFWTQAVEPHHTRWVRHAVDAILSTHADEKPDSLLISDDHLVEPVADALEEFGLRVPQDIRVIGHWNFPLVYQKKVPIELLGFDIRELVREWVDAIDAQRRGEKIPSFAALAPRFASEIAEPFITNTTSAAVVSAAKSSATTASV